ncbi:MAG: GNAT family N-acetyltransferase [Candidatus Odinarchaeota archaeon]
MRIDFSARKTFWKRHTKLACYFTGAVDILVEEDTDDTVDRYLVNRHDETVACFCVGKRTIYDIAYLRTQEGMQEELLEYLITKWTELTKLVTSNETRRIRLLFPSCDREQLERLGFQFRHQRDRLTMLLADWEHKEVRNHSLVIRQTGIEDARQVTEIYIDAYQGTIDGQLFSPEGLNYDDELRHMSSFLANQSKDYPIIEPASLVAISGESEIIGFCYSCNWKGLPLIWDFAVSKKHQGKGIGKILLKESLLKLEKEGYEQVALFVTKGNERARKLYDSLGFKADDCTLLVLEKEIQV